MDWFIASARRKSERRTAFERKWTYLIGYWIEDEKNAIKWQPCLHLAAHKWPPFGYRICKWETFCHFKLLIFRFELDIYKGMHRRRTYIRRTNIIKNINSRRNFAMTAILDIVRRTEKARIFHLRQSPRNLWASIMA